MVTINGAIGLASYGYSIVSNIEPTTDFIHLQHSRNPFRLT